MHLDTDLIINGLFGRKTLEWLPDPAWQVQGSGSFDGIRTKVAVTVDVEPLDLSEAFAKKPARPPQEADRETGAAGAVKGVRTRRGSYRGDRDKRGSSRCADVRRSVRRA